MEVIPGTTLTDGIGSNLSAILKVLSYKLDKEISPQPALIFYGPLAKGYMDHEN